MKIITTKNEWQQLLIQSEKQPVIIFKHSATCPISAAAHRQMQEFEGDPIDASISKVIVQNSREVSDQIAEDLGIEHESPQVIIMVKQQSVYDVSHHSIEADDVRKHFEEVHQRVSEPTMDNPVE